MEQIIVAILALLFSGIIAAVKEYAKKKSTAAAPAVPDFLDNPAPRRPAAPGTIPVPPRPATIPELPLPDEGQRVTDDSAPAIYSADPADDNALQLHRERWRRAIIDAEIISPKY